MTGDTMPVVMPFCKRPPFTLQKVAFWRVKDGLLEGERRSFAEA